MGARLKKSNQQIFVLVGDGEINEGPIWEGALFAAHHQLDNFMVIVDENGFQAMGETTEILRLNSIKSKFESFGFESIEVDGHDEEAIQKTVQQLMQSTNSSPKALIARTVKGKGVPFMENNNIWHYTRLDEKTYTQALQAVEIDTP
jgi:transketolase